MPIVDLTDEEHAAVTAAIKRAIGEDRFPRAPRLDPLRAALAKLDPAAADALRRPLTAKAPSPRPNSPQPTKAVLVVLLAGLVWRLVACRMQGQRRHR